jgi:hypothetical protein
MMGGGGGGGSGGSGRNSGDGDGKDSSSSDSGKKSKDKKDKKEDGGRKGEGDNGNTNTISDTSGNLIDDLFGTGDESSSSATTSTTTTTDEQPTLSSTKPTETVIDIPKPPELPQNFGLVSSQKILGDGSKVVVEHNPMPGGVDTFTTTWSTDGTVTSVRKNPDGYETTSKWIPVGDSKYIYHEDSKGLKITIEPDGTSTTELSDGKSSTLLPDDTEIQKEPVPNAPGQFIVYTIRADHTKTVKEPDGRETFFDADGNTQKIVFPKKDGTFDVYDPNAGTTINTSTKPDR